MPMVKRGLIIERAFKAVRTLEKPTTIRELSEALNVNYKTAQNWITSMSLVLPVSEVGKVYHGIRPSVQYQIVGDI